MVVSSYSHIQMPVIYCSAVEGYKAGHKILEEPVHSLILHRKADERDFLLKKNRKESKIAFKDHPFFC